MCSFSLFLGAKLDSSKSPAGRKERVGANGATAYVGIGVTSHERKRLMSTMHCSLLSLGCVFGFSTPAQQSTLTALAALKIAQRRLRPEVRTKLLSVTSPRTGVNLAPEAWRFVFFDQGTSGNCRIVTVAAKTSSEHPDTVEAFSSIRSENVSRLQVIPQNKLLINSNQALDRARSASKLKGVRSAEYRLLHPAHGAESFWELHFFAENDEPVARFRIGAKTGITELIGNSNNHSSAKVPELQVS
jgi:hypothetical protein